MICNLAVFTSSMTEQMCLTHWVMACGVPEMVTALSVESGSMSPATWTWAPVVLTLAYIGIKKKKNIFSFLAVSSSPKLSQTQFDMQRAAASQIEMCAPIFEEVHTNIVHSECVCRLLIFLGIIREIFKSSSQAKTMHQHLLKKEINKRSLTEVFGTWSNRAPMKIFTPWVLKNKFLF